MLKRVQSQVSGWGIALIALCLAGGLLLTACGKKGDPIPPENPVAGR